jgi:uncharacterized membrane protein HdeD (DUF308 family)
MMNLGKSKILLCIMGAVMFILGVFVLLLMMSNLKMLALTVGVGFIVAGIFCLLSFFSEKEILLNPGWVLIQGFLNIFMGFFILWNLRPNTVTITYIIAFFFFFSGISKFSASFVLKRIGFDKWQLVLINGAFGLFISCLIVFFPFFGTKFSLALAGLYLMVYGVLVAAESLTTKTPELSNFAFIKSQ